MMNNSKIERLKVIQEIWVRVCNEHMEEYTKAFAVSRRDFTKYISLFVELLAKELKLQVIGEYYSLDFVLYKEEDLVPYEGKTWNQRLGNWLRHIRVVLEHENSLDSSSGGYQEFSHLMLTTADAKVLVGYGEKYDSYDLYAYDYQSLMKNLDYSPDPILFIGEYFSTISQHGLIFESYIIAANKILKYIDIDDNWVEMKEVV